MPCGAWRFGLKLEKERSEREKSDAVGNASLLLRAQTLCSVALSAAALSGRGK
jgi:hypothetical protein